MDSGCESVGWRKVLRSIDPYMMLVLQIFGCIFGSDVKIVGAKPLKIPNYISKIQVSSLFLRDIFLFKFYWKWRSLKKLWDAELENLRGMTPEEADAAVAEACERTVVTVQEAKYAMSELEKAASHLRAKREMYSRTELQNISHQTPEEAVNEAIAKCDAASDAATRALCAAKCAAVKSKRFVEAISKAREKRPMTDCEGQGASCSN